MHMVSSKPNASLGAIARLAFWLALSVILLCAFPAASAYAIDIFTFEDQYSEEGSDALFVPEEPLAGLSLTVQSSLASYGNDGVLIVALDPGHGGRENGAVSYVVEKDVNWKIAQYCRERLVQYPGVRVVLTRGQDETVTLNERTSRAVGAGADVIISLHNNAQDDSTHGASGYQVYHQYVESSYRLMSTAVPSRAISECLAARLKSVGVNPQDASYNGLKIRISSGDYYADGSLSDYYGMLRIPRKNNLPAVLVEHMYVDNPSDGTKLQSDKWLRALGYADADGIMDYYGYDKQEWANNFDSETSNRMYRLYNPNSGEHFYTASESERNSVAKAGWVYEGIGWIAPKKSSVPVYRLYNPNAGDHHYTTSADERDSLTKMGWNYEGIGWYSDENHTVAILREYNPYAIAGAHNFTASTSEHRNLVSLGWHDEKTAWYALGAA